MTKYKCNFLLSNIHDNIHLVNLLKLKLMSTYYHEYKNVFVNLTFP